MADQPIRSDRSALRAISITPNDSADLDVITRGMYVGVSGDLAVHMADGSIATFVGLAAGVIHPLSVVRVLATGTTATDIIGLY